MDALMVRWAPDFKFQPALKIEIPGRVHYIIDDTMEEFD
jgi:hypothetical protein